MSRTHHLTDRSSAPRRRTLALGPLFGAVVILAGTAPFGGVKAASPLTSDASDGARPSIQYEEAAAHEHDHIAFSPGGRVRVPFAPRGGDRWTIGGARPKPLPAGRVTGKALRGGPLTIAPAVFTEAPTTTLDAWPPDSPLIDPAEAGRAQLAAVVTPGGLKREVFGFLPYWELTDPSTTLDWEKLSTIAYFGVGTTATGDLLRTNRDGSTTVGWSGWTSSRLTSVIDAAHAHGTRVVLTVQSFAWTSTGVKTQKALLGSATARANLARQIAAAVRDRGADGVNLDFEPIVSTYSDEFTALVRAVRSALDKVTRGYQLTFDATGWIGNYPIEAATAAGAADAVLIMGYDYRSGSSTPVGSIAPVGGPSYDIADTLAAYLSRVPPSKVILGVPYYGRAWSTSSSAIHARNVSGTKNGASTSVVYGTARQFASDHGRRYDPTEGVAWTAYPRQNCTATYGCVNTWRQLYYDDAKALGAKYDLVNRYGLRGAGIWALGYDGSRPELYALLKAKFITDTVPPTITGSSISSTVLSPNGDGRSDSVTVRVAVTGLIRYGWVVEPFADGIAGPPVRSGSVAGLAVAYTWDGKRADGSRVPDGPYRITIWTADASNNRASVRQVVTVDATPAVVTSTATPPVITPDGDGVADRTTVAMHADSAITGRVRLVDRRGITVRSWTMPTTTSGTWTWDGRDKAGRTVDDGPFSFRVDGLDRAGNRTIRDVIVRVDRTIRSLDRATAAFTPARHTTDRLSFRLGRVATVSLAIYRGPTLIRAIWAAKRLARGTYAWTWDGRTAAGALVKPGTYTVIVAATSWIAVTRRTTTVTVRAP